MASSRPGIHGPVSPRKSKPIPWARKANPASKKVRLARTTWSISALARTSSHERMRRGCQPRSLATDHAARSYHASCRSTAPRSSRRVFTSSAGQSLFEDRAQAGRSSHAIGRGRPRLRAPSQIRHPGVVDRRTPSSGRARGHGLGDLPGSRVVRHVAPARARGPRPSIRSGRSMGSHRHARSARCSFWSRRLHRRGPAARCPGRGGCHDRRARTRSESLGAGSRLGLASSKYTTRRSTITYLAAITGRWSPTASHRTASTGTGSTGFGTMAS